MKTLSALQDNELVELFSRGNEYAFNVLFNRHRKELYRVIFFYVKDDCLAEDILQDVFIRIFRSIRLGAYSEQGKFLPWALRISYHLSLDQLRSSKRKPTLISYEHARNERDNSEPDAEMRVFLRQSEQRVKSILGSLPEEQRDVLSYRHFHDMSFKEIAFVMNTSVNTALGRMRYGLNNLRKKMHGNKHMLYQ